MIGSPRRLGTPPRRGLGAQGALRQQAPAVPGPPRGARAASAAKPTRSAPRCRPLLPPRAADAGGEARALHQDLHRLQRQAAVAVRGAPGGGGGGGRQPAGGATAGAACARAGDKKSITSFWMPGVQVNEKGTVPVMKDLATGKWTVDSGEVPERRCSEGCHCCAHLIGARCSSACLQQPALPPAFQGAHLRPAGWKAATAVPSPQSPTPCLAAPPLPPHPSTHTNRRDC